MAEVMRQKKVTEVERVFLDSLRSNLVVDLQGVVDAARMYYLSVKDAQDKGDLLIYAKDDLDCLLAELGTLSQRLMYISKG